MSDIHGHLDNLQRVLLKEVSIDTILVAGDITHFGPGEVIREFDNICAELAGDACVYFVLGNCDPFSEIEPLLPSLRGQFLHSRFISRDGLSLAGISGGLLSIFHTVNEKGELIFQNEVEKIEDQLNSLPPAFTILVTHQPGQGSLDRVMLNHVGSPAIRRLQPRFRLHVCGHIHEALGTVQTADTYVVNPGPLKKGYYALGYIDNSQLTHVELKKI